MDLYPPPLSLLFPTPPRVSVILADKGEKLEEIYPAGAGWADEAKSAFFLRTLCSARRLMMT